MAKILAMIFVCVSGAVAKDLYHTMNVGYISDAPDGVLVDHVLTANNKFPGYEIRGKVGDTLHANVINNIIDKNGKTQGTTIHWHGLFLANGLGIYDGPDGVTQCAIAFNRSMNYDFKLEQSGTYWWHSHHSYQYTEGLWGPLIIEDDNDPYLNDYDFDNMVFTLSDWYHKPAQENLDRYKSPAHIFPVPDSALLNGHGTYPCGNTNLTCNQQEPLVYEVMPGGRYRIRIINVSSFWMFKFYIDGHKLEVIEVDGVTTRRAPCDYISMSAGQRYSVIVTMNAESSTSRDFFIHAENDNGDVREEAHTKAILRYTGELKNVERKPKDLEMMAYAPVELDERNLVPYNEFPPTGPTQNVFLELVEKVVDNLNYMTLNGTIQHAAGPPVLYNMIHNLSIPESANPIFIEYGKVIEVELYNSNPRPHPFHLHGHNFWVVANGPANGGKRRFTYPEPIRRDTVTVQGNSTVVFKFEADNPGAWLFHCHINWHHLVGLAAVFVEGQEQLRKDENTYTYPTWAKDICHQSGVIPFSCENSGIFPDPTNCQSYYRCEQANDGAFQRYSLSCPQGMTFSPRWSSCQLGFGCLD